MKGNKRDLRAFGLVTGASRVRPLVEAAHATTSHA
jgi:hypothetical protein